jgi:hypothetical protein
MQLLCEVVYVVDHIENTAFTSTSIVACVTVAMLTWRSQGHSLATGIFSD